MKLFETALKNFAFLGTVWDESSQKYIYEIRKKLVAVYVGLLCFILTFIFLIKDAKTFDEYTEALFICSTAFMCSVITAEIFFKLEKFSKFTRTCKIAINNSKWTHSYFQISISLRSNLALDFCISLTLLSRSWLSKIRIVGMKCPESKIIFDKHIEQTEKWSKIITVFVTRVVPLCGVLSRAGPSFFFYFTTDLGNEAFELPTKMW